MMGQVRARAAARRAAPQGSATFMFCVGLAQLLFARAPTLPPKLPA
jgi:hypothetical protein